MGKKLPPLLPETSRINELPDDVLLHIMSFLPTLVQISRTSVLSRRWRNLWHNITCLDFDPATLPSWEMFKNIQALYIEWVNKIIDDRIATPRLPSVKNLRIWYALDKWQWHHIDRWIDFAASNQIESLHLEFAFCNGVVNHSRQYKLWKESWCGAPSGLSNLKCLKSLYLSCVNVSKEFIEFMLLSCLLLEDLSLLHAGNYTNLDVSGVLPLQLRRLRIEAVEDPTVTKLCAPYLTSFCYRACGSFNPQKIDVPLLTDLTIGGRRYSQHIMHYLDHFWRYLPQLERLDLLMDEPRNSS